LHYDPWDNYLYFDSKFFLDFVFHLNIQNIDNLKFSKDILAQTIEINFILMFFLNFIFHNDLLANFRIDGKSAAILFLNFFKEKECEFLNNFLFQILCKKIEPTCEEISKFETEMEELFELFIENLNSTKRFSDVKEDYFKV